MREARRGGGSTRSDIGRGGARAGTERDVLFELLSHPYRRFVLQYLDDAGDVPTVREVATELGAWQTEFPVAERSATGVEAIEVDLHHQHLPKLAAADVIEYDPTRGTITPETRADETIRYLDAIGGG